jgi:hypothetical protein
LAPTRSASAAPTRPPTATTVISPARGGRKCLLVPTRRRTSLHACLHRHTPLRMRTRGGRHAALLHASASTPPARLARRPRPTLTLAPASLRSAESRSATTAPRARPLTLTGAAATRPATERTTGEWGGPSASRALSFFPGPLCAARFSPGSAAKHGSPWRRVNCRFAPSLRAGPARSREQSSTHTSS